MDHVIIDTLHLFLRISDILLDNFIRDLKAKDELEKISFRSGKNAEKFTSYINSLGIPFKLTINPDSKNLQFREMNGPERLILFENCDLEVLFPEHENICNIAQLWKTFLDIYGELRKAFAAEVDPFSKKIEAWIKDFLFLYQINQVTPYMHALWAHVPDFLRLYACIGDFNQQGLEKCNDEVSKCYFRATNHKGKDAM